MEKTLRWRYTWLGIIASFLIGGGVATVVSNLTGDAREKIIEARVVLERIRKDADDVDRLAAGVRTKLAGLEQSLQARFDDLDTKLGEKEREVDELFSVRSASAENLDRALQQLQGLTGRVDSLTDVVDSVLRTAPQSARAAPDYPRAEQEIHTLKGSQPQLARQIQDTSDRVKLSQHSVYAHYAPQSRSDAKRIEQIVASLRAQGYVIPDVRPVTQKTRSVRYFFEQDRPVAEELKRAIDASLQSAGIPDVSVQVLDMTSYKPKPRTGVIEVWLYF